LKSPAECTTDFFDDGLGDSRLKKRSYLRPAKLLGARLAAGACEFLTDRSSDVINAMRASLPFLPAQAPQRYRYRILLSLFLSHTVA
jgi:hypothetical protein